MRSFSEVIREETDNKKTLSVSGDNGKTHGQKDQEE